MDHQKKLDFVLRMTKHALDSVQHFDSGGTVLTGPTSIGTPNAVNPNQGVLGGIGDFLGTNNNFQAGSATINPGTNTAQLNEAYSGVQNGLNSANNLQGTLAPGVNQGVNSQNLLTNQLVAESQGGGPNPAQAALNLNTGRNIAQTAALAAGTRGAGTNAGLIASNVARQGAETQQEAAGQEAVLQAQQQINAQNQLQNLAGTQVGQGTGAVQLQNQVQQNEQNVLQGANTAANNAAVSQQENINNVNAAVASSNQQANQNVAGGIGGFLGSIGKFIGFAEGGKVELPSHLDKLAKIYHPHMAAGGAVGPWENSIPVSSGINSGGPINLGSNVSNLSKAFSYDRSIPAPPSNQPIATAPPTEFNSTATLSSPIFGSSRLEQSEMAKGGKVAKELKEGGKVPGKPKVNHDAYENDTVDAKLSPGEVVIDLDTLKAKGKLGEMARFVAKNIERKKMGRAV